MNGNGNLGPLTPYHPPTLGALRGYSVNREGQAEVVWSPRYDYQVYPTTGATQFTFFQTPVGQGGTTLADTNMQSAGQMPRPQEFLVTGIQVVFSGGNPVSAAAAVAQNWLDVNDVIFGDAWLDLFIGSKSYLQDGPIAKFPQQFRLGGAVDEGTGAFMVDYAVGVGRYYAITPVKLTANQNFNVTLNFPTAVTVVTEATIGVILDGFLYRLSQ